MNKLILADNQAIFRAGTAKILAMEDDFRIIAQCSEPERLYPALETFRGAILLFSSSMKLDPAALVPRVLGAGSRSIVIAENGESVQPWFSAGVNGAAHRNVTGPALIECVRHVGQGDRQVRATGIDAPGFEEDSVGSRVRDRLTPKELKIVALIVQGCKNKEIAVRLCTTEQVIKNYLRSIYDKTGVSDRLELALFTIHHRMLAEAAQAIGDQILQTL
ncbi:MAG TPA: response regulator transcription factor [Acidobacteriaceae bacterium]|jgi:DNA-binding NarL/FixJ family response regulator